MLVRHHSLALEIHKSFMRNGGKLGNRFSKSLTEFSQRELLKRNMKKGYLNVGQLYGNYGYNCGEKRE